MNKETEINILIGSCGGLTGQYLIKSYKNYSEHPKIYGSDISEFIYSKHLCDDFFLVPSVNQEQEFIKVILSIIKSKRIDLYIPTLSSEIFLISKSIHEIREQVDCFICVSPYDTFLKLDDKASCYKELNKIGIDIPTIYKNIDEIDRYPVFVKPRISSGGRGAYKVANSERLGEIDSSTCIMEHLEGEEYTIDCLFDCKGVLLAINARTREKTLGGASVISRNISPELFTPLILNISKNFEFYGCVNFQFIKTKNRIVCIDVNLRFPSGGLPLTVESGINIPLAYYQWAKGEKVSKYIYSHDNKQRVMYRYFEEYFEVL